nr:hypothetical protein [Massilia sp. Se16.2.3]
MNKPLDFPCRDTLLAAQLNAYLHSHGAEARALLGLPATSGLRVELDEGAGPIACVQADGDASLRMQSADALKILAYSHSFQWANGIVIVPTLTKLVESGAFRDLAPGETRSMLAFARSQKADPSATRARCGAPSTCWRCKAGCAAKAATGPCAIR